MDEKTIDVSLSYLRKLKKKHSDPSTLFQNIRLVEEYTRFGFRLEVGDIPEGVERLTLPWFFNEFLTVKVLPLSLTYLAFGTSYNQILGPGVLPENLTSIHFGSNFNQIIEPHVLPRNLVNITFGTHFNQRIEPNTFPDSVRSIAFGENFNQCLDHLPKHLQRLEVGRAFDQELAPGVLPRSLEYIVLPRPFRKPIEIPPSCRLLLFTGYHETLGLMPWMSVGRLSSCISGLGFLLVLLVETLYYILQDIRHRWYVRKLKQKNPLLEVIYN